MRYSLHQRMAISAIASAAARIMARTGANLVHHSMKSSKLRNYSAIVGEANRCSNAMASLSVLVPMG